ncbi:unnamed protein product [Rotaria sordida]|uniref:Uncharacterized protein n=1 Tax=Rotaria sordida TaxID=392033 RepID=A0A814SI62_9BILA|nr:unnamed protein product [Rotaria sordida]
MNSNYSNFNTLPIYKLYFDDIEELFLHKISFKYLFISSLIICFFILASIIILLYRSKTIFLACLIPFIYSLLFYDFIQLLSIILLKYNLININEKYFGEICRWPYYLKAASEAGQCLTLVLICAIRSQKIRHFLKHNYLSNTGHIHARALTFVCLLFIIYVNNWITHLKVEKIHVVTLNQSNYGINIQEYPITFYGRNHVKLNDYEQFYLDLEKYTQNYEKFQIGQNKGRKIIHNDKDDSVNEIVIKIPYGDFYGQQNTIKLNRTRRKLGKRRHILNKTIYGNNSYRIHRCTFGQRNFFLANFLSLIHSICYLILIIYYLTTIYRYKIPYITTDYRQNLHHEVYTLGRKKSVDRYKQIMLLIHLRRFQYVVIYCYTTIILIRLIYVCSFTFILCLIQSPFKWLTMKIFYYILFIIVYYSIPLRIIVLFIYLFLSLFSSHIHSIVYYIFHTKLHFSCKLQKPTVRFHLHIVQYPQRNLEHDKHSKDSLVLDLTSSIYDEQTPISINETIGIYEENSSNQPPIRTSI